MLASEHPRDKRRPTNRVFIELFEAWDEFASEVKGLEKPAH
jgi:hypothetical protein